MQLILPSKFECSKCSRHHALETLLEFPLPDNISEITSGKSAGELKIISKNIYKVNDEVYMFVSLKIPIKQYYDDFEIQNWIRIDAQECLRISDAAKRIARENSHDTSFIAITGKMVYPIPVYGISDYPIVKVSYPPSDLLPEVELVNTTNQLYIDWKHGIDLKKLEEFILSTGTRCEKLGSTDLLGDQAQKPCTSPSSAQPITNC